MYAGLSKNCVPNAENAIAPEGGHASNIGNVTDSVSVPPGPLAEDLNGVKLDLLLELFARLQVQMDAVDRRCARLEELAERAAPLLDNPLVRFRTNRKRPDPGKWPITGPHGGPHA